MIKENFLHERIEFACHQNIQRMNDKRKIIKAVGVTGDGRTCWTVFVAFTVEVTQIACGYHFIEVFQGAVHVVLVTLEKHQARKAFLHSSPFFIHLVVLEVLKLDLKARVGVRDFSADADDLKCVAPIQGRDRHDVYDADGDGPGHSRQAVDQHVAVASQSGTVDEVIAHGKKLRQVLIRRVRGHHAKVMFFRKQVLRVVMDGQNVSDSVHLQLVNVLGVPIVADIKAR